MNEGEEFDTYQEQKEEQQVDLEQKTQQVEEEEEHENDLEEQPLEWDIANEVAPRIEIDELIAEYEMLEEELGELLPLDALILKEEELEVGNSHSDNEDTLIEIDVNQNTIILQIEEKTIEVKEEPETYEIISTSVPKEELEVFAQQETNIQTEQDIGENIEEYQLDVQETESVLSCINQVIDELIAEKEFSELELIRLEKELEEIIEDKFIPQGDEEIAKEVPEDIEGQQEELQIDNNETSITEQHDEIFIDYQSNDEQINDISEFVTLEIIDYEKTTFDQNFDDEIQSQLTFAQSEINLSVDGENLEDTLPQPSINELISQFIEITQLNSLPHQPLFDLSDFSINLQDENFNSLEKILEKLESPHLLGQFHSQMEEEIQQLFDIETYQTRSEINASLEMVSQGPPLPEPPPYDFQAELAELEEELEEQEKLSKSLLRSFYEAQKAQLAAIRKFIPNKNLSPKKGNYRSSIITTNTSNSIKNSPKKKSESRTEKEKKSDSSRKLEETRIYGEASDQKLSANSEVSITEQEDHEKDNPVISLEHEALKTGEYAALKALAREWNNYMTNGGRLTVEMCKTYNKIQDLYNKPLVLYKMDDEINAYRMSVCGKLFFQLDSYLFNQRLSNRSKQVSKLLDYWLVQIGKKEGIKLFFDVTIKNPNTQKMETYWIPNTKEKSWNPYKAKHREFFNIRSSSWARITEFLATKIHLNKKDIKLYYRIERSLKKKYPKLGVQTGNKPFSTLGTQKLLFKNVYRLNYPKDVIDEAIKLTFWKYAGTHAYRDANTVTLRKDITQERINLSRLISSIQKSNVTQRIYRLSVDGSVSYQNWTDDLVSTIKSSDPNFLIYETIDGEINGVSAPHLVKKIKDLLFLNDKHSVKSAGRMFNNLIALADYEPPLNLGTYCWKRLFPISTDLHQLGIPEPYQTTFIYCETTSPEGQLVEQDG